MLSPSFTNYAGLGLISTTHSIYYTYITILHGYVWCTLLKEGEGVALPFSFLCSSTEHSFIISSNETSWNIFTWFTCTL